MFFQHYRFHGYSRTFSSNCISLPIPDAGNQNDRMSVDQAASGTGVRRQEAQDSWLVSGGEIGKLMRSMDWAKSPLGPIELWPQSLRTAVSICLGSRHPIALWWGPERWMFYNDAYRPMLGHAKHPQFLGRPGQACWS